MSPTFAPAQASHRRWVLDALEVAALGVQTSAGAAVDVGVLVGGDRVRLPAADGSGRPGRLITFADAVERGVVPVSVVFDDERVGDAVTQLAPVDARVTVAIDLPNLEATAFDRWDDLADAAERDVVLAIMDDQTLGGLVSGVILREARGLEVIGTETGAARFCERSLEVRYHHDPLNMQRGPGTPAGAPEPGALVELFTVQADVSPAPGSAVLTVTDDEARVTIDDGGGAAVVVVAPLIDQTIADVHAVFAASGSLTTSALAGFGTLPAADLERVEATDVLLAPGGVSIR